MPPLIRIVPAGILAAVIALSAAACSPARSGVSQAPTTSPLAGLTADQIIQKAVNDLSAASSVQIVSKGATSGQDFALAVTDVAAQGCQGTLTLTGSASSAGAAGSGEIAIIQVHGIGYLKAPESYLKSLGAPASMLTELNGKYLRATSASKTAYFSAVCDLSDLSKSLEKNTLGFVKAGTATVDGQAVLAFKGPNNADDGTFYITNSATPEVVSFQGTASDPGFFDLAHYNARVTITVPPASDVIDGSQFGF